MSGGGLADPVSTVSAGDGSYAFSGVPYGATYTLEAHDPAGVYPDQVMAGLTLTPNDTTTPDVTLRTTQSGPGAVLATRTLPGTACDISVDWSPTGASCRWATRCWPSTSRQPAGHVQGAVVCGRFGSRRQRQPLREPADRGSHHRDQHVDAHRRPVVADDAPDDGRAGLRRGSRLVHRWQRPVRRDQLAGPGDGDGRRLAGTLVRARFRNIEGSSTLFYAYDVGVSPRGAYVMDGSRPPSANGGRGWVRVGRRTRRPRWTDCGGPVGTSTAVGSGGDRGDLPGRRVPAGGVFAGSGWGAGVRQGHRSGGDAEDDHVLPDCLMWRCSMRGPTGCSTPRLVVGGVGSASASAVGRRGAVHRTPPRRV